MLQEKIERINFLAAKSRKEGLTDEEKQEQKKLREEYLQEWRQGVVATLENTYIVDKDGNKRKLQRKDDEKGN